MHYLVSALFFILPLLSVSKFDKERLVLTQEMLQSAQESFIIKGDYTLKGKCITIPEGVTLVFSGGSLFDGELRGTNTDIIVEGTRPVFGMDLVISGLWSVREVHDGWFFFDDSPGYVANQLINNILSFSNDKSPCHIFFEEDRVYYFELPYKGRTDIGNMLSLQLVDGKQKRNYAELYNDTYSYLRIFTIPSNTHLTINNQLKMLPTNQGAYFVFWEYGKENVTVDGIGLISGDNDWHRYDSVFAGKHYYGEWGHIFRCIRCSNFTFKDITLTDAFGDCIIYSGSFYPNERNTRWASNLTLENVKVLRARRNGVAVSARHVRIRGCYFEGCGTKDVHGTLPRCGIDFEPDQLNNYPEIGNEDVLMEKCSFKNNYYDVASYNNNLKGFGRIATVIRDCNFTSKLKIQATNWMRFENCYIPFMYNKNNKRSAMIYCKHMEFVNCDFGQYDITVLGLASNVTNKYTDCRFNVDK